MNLRKYIRDIPDFPKKGIIFKDITPLLSNPRAFEFAVKQIAGKYKNSKIAGVVGIESRGFIIGSIVACLLGTGFIPVRKKGKLPYKTRCASYGLEYGTDSIEIHEDAVKKGKNYLLVDDLLATGGTMAACCQLVECLGGKVLACQFVIELSFLKGRDKLRKYTTNSLIIY